jgi:arabinan endo-1,5-alpha-L-arabinosidase
MRSAAYCNPVHPDYFADPFVWRCGDEYFAIGTGPAEAGGEVRSADGPTIFPLLRSRDLAHWERAGRALVRPPEALGDSFWAPEIASQDDRWFLYYSVGHGERLHQLRVAVSDRPLGPYCDLAGLTDPAECAFAIDPHPFRDDDGRWYLFHARDFLDAERARPGTALVVHELARMTELAREGRTVARAQYEWQRYQANRAMYGGVYDWHTLEGPCVVKHGGRYYCFYSGGCWQTESYGVDYLAASHVLGPYEGAGAEDGPRVLRSAPGKLLGPGHCSVVVGPDDATLYVAYHAWDAERSARRMCLDALHFTSEGPRVEGPSCEPREIAHAGGASRAASP